MKDSQLWFAAAVVALVGAVSGITLAGNAASGGVLAVFAAVFLVMGLQAQKKTGRS